MKVLFTKESVEFLSQISFLFSISDKSWYRTSAITEVGVLVPRSEVMVKIVAAAIESLESRGTLRHWKIIEINSAQSVHASSNSVTPS